MTGPNSLLLVNEHDLTTDLSEFSAAIVRELYLAVRKLEGGELDFATAQRALDRPLSHLRKWFRLFRVADLDCSGTTLRFGGVGVAESPFATSLVRLLQERGTRHLVFVPPVSPPEMHALLRGLGAPGDKGTLSQQLADRGIRCIHLDDPEWQGRLRERPVPEPNAEGHVVLQEYVQKHWSGVADLVCHAAAGGVPAADKLALRWHCYATPQIIEAVLAPHFTALPSQAVLEHARAQLEGGERESGDGMKVQPPLSYWQGLIAAVVRHPYGYELTHALRDLLRQHQLALNVDELLDTQVRRQYEATGRVDELTTRCFSTACTVDDLRQWGPAFVGLLRIGPSDQAATILEALLLHLKRDDRDARRKAHYLLGRALAAAGATDELRVIRWLAERITQDLVAGEETYEFSDLLAGAGEMLLSAGQWESLAPLAGQLGALQKQEAHPARERVCQAVLERWRQPRWISLLFRAAEENADSGGEAAAMLAALGGREVALQAASLITHAQRRVRLAMLEVLSSLGDEAVSICEELVSPHELWRCRKDGGALADLSWYTIRNAFHILGRIGGERALARLKQHQADPDRRVRLEIVRALERMGTPEARAFLVSLAEDESVEVRRAALSALGTVGGEHEVFILQEFFRFDLSAAESALLAMGHIGGRAAKDFLFRIVEKDDLFTLPGHMEKAESLRESALKALVQNPDSEIVSRIEAYCRRTKRTFRIPLVTDTLSDTARIRLERSRDSVKRT